MRGKLAIAIYVLFAISSFFFGIKMFEMGETLRGILFMVAVACWLMCIYNVFGTDKREKKRLDTYPTTNKKSSKSKKR